MLADKTTQGVDLRQYARQIDGELEDVEVDTIGDCE